MRLIIDANILIAAMIKDSTIREIILKSGHDFFAPEEVVKEVLKYVDVISKKSRLPRSENIRFLSILLDYVFLVPTQFFSGKIKKADKIIGDIDKGDVPYIALALSFPNHGIWTEDKHFQKQKKIKIWSTEDLAKKVLKY